MKTLITTSSEKHFAIIHHEADQKDINNEEGYYVGPDWHDKDKDLVKTEPAIYSIKVYKQDDNIGSIEMFTVPVSMINAIYEATQAILATPTEPKVIDLPF